MSQGKPKPKSNLFKRVAKSSKTDPTSSSSSPQSSNRAFFPSSDSTLPQSQDAQQFLYSKTYQEAIQSLRQPPPLQQDQDQSPMPIPSSSRWNITRSRSAKKARNNSLSQLEPTYPPQPTSIFLPNQPSLPNNHLYKSVSFPLPPRGILCDQTLPYLDWALTTIRNERLNSGQDWEEINSSQMDHEESYQQHLGDALKVRMRNLMEDQGVGEGGKTLGLGREKGLDQEGHQDVVAASLEVPKRAPLDRLLSNSGASVGHGKALELPILDFQSDESSRKQSPSGQVGFTSTPPALLPVKDRRDSVRDSPEKKTKIFKPDRDSNLSYQDSSLPFRAQDAPQEEMETIQTSGSGFEGGADMERSASDNSNHSFYSTASSSAGNRMRRFSAGAAALFTNPNGGKEKEQLRSSHQQVNSHFEPVSEPGDTPQPTRSTSRLRTISAGFLNLVGLASRPASPPLSAPLSPLQDVTPKHTRFRSDLNQAPKSNLVSRMEDSWKQEELRWKKEQGISMPEDDEEERVLDSTFSDDYEDLENRSENYHSSGSHQSHSSFLSALGGLSRHPSQIEKRRRSSNTTNNTSSSPRQAFTELKRRLSKGSNQELDTLVSSRSRSGSHSFKDPFVSSTNATSNEESSTPTRGTTIRLLSFTKRAKAKQRKDSGTALSSAAGSKLCQLDLLSSNSNFRVAGTQYDQHFGNQETRNLPNHYYSSSSNYVDSSPSKLPAFPPPVPPKSTSRIEIPSSIDAYPAQLRGISPSRIKEWAVNSSKEAEAVESPVIEDGKRLESESEREIREEMEEMERREEGGAAGFY